MARNTRNAYGPQRKPLKSEKQPLGCFFVAERPDGARQLCETRLSGFVRVLRDLPKA